VEIQASYNLAGIQAVYHHLDDRIRSHYSHLLACHGFGAGMPENMTDKSWYQIETALADLTTGLIESDKVNLWYCSDISDEAKDIFKKLNIALPKKVLSTVPREAAAV